MNDERQSWAYLARVAEPPCAGLAGLVAEVGPVEAAARIKRGDVSDALARLTQARRRIGQAPPPVVLDNQAGEFQHRQAFLTSGEYVWPAAAFPAPRGC